MSITNVDRIGEAWDWLQQQLEGRPMPPLVALIGLGDGSILDALDRHAPQTRVLALEPNPANAQAFLSTGTAERWRTSGRLVYLVDPAYAGADEAWRLFPAGVLEPMLLVHPQVAMGEGVARAAQQLKRIIFGVEANAEARRKFAPRYLVNSLRNIPAIVAGADVRNLADAYRGMPAIIAGAGPSLNRGIGELRGMGDRGLIIAADTALRPMLVGGVTPHMVAALDPSDVNARHLLSLPECKDTWLISESAMDRKATAGFDSRTFWFRVANHHPWPWLNELGIDVSLVDVWGSVITAAFQVACLAGCDPIVFVGADLSFPGGQPYARGTTFEFDWAWAAITGRSLDETWRMSLANSEPRRDVNGGEAATTPSLVSVRDWLVARAARSGRRVINATGAGILFGEGIEIATLADALPTSVTVPAPSQFAKRFEKVRPSALTNRVRTVRSAVAAGKLDAPLQQWVEFSGGGFNAAAVGAALDDAARGLETKRGASPASSLIPWNEAADTFSRLAESLVRMPAALSSTYRANAAASADAVAPAERVELLRHAWDLLERLCDATLRAGNLELQIDADFTGQVPVSALYAWPEATRWAVLLFEGMLGRAWTEPPRESESAYFSAPPTAPAAVDARKRASRSHAERACTLLALEWLRAAGASPALCAAIDEALHDDAARSSNKTAGKTLSVQIDGPRFARALTGLLRRDSDSPRQLDLRTLVSLGGEPLFVKPRVLSKDDGRDRLYLGYATPEGVICTRRSPTRETVIVDASSVIKPHRTWPRPVTALLPWGDQGFIAWSNGLHNAPDIESAYVMYQRNPDESVVVEQLPVRPSSGCWWHDRVYWSCLSWAAGWQGLVSWAPGEGVKVAKADVTLWGAQPQDDGLLLEPCDFEPSRGFTRRIITEGLKLRPGQADVPANLGPYGAASACDTRGEWTACAHPDADVIRLRRNDGTSLSLTCSYPVRVAWAGDSLVVSTARSEVLFFENLVEVLSRS